MGRSKNRSLMGVSAYPVAHAVRARKAPPGAECPDVSYASFWTLRQQFAPCWRQAIALVSAARCVGDSHFAQPGLKGGLHTRLAEMLVVPQFKGHTEVFPGHWPEIFCRSRTSPLSSVVTSLVISVVQIGRLFYQSLPGQCSAILPIARSSAARSRCQSLPSPWHRRIAHVPGRTASFP